MQNFCLKKDLKEHILTQTSVVDSRIEILGFVSLYLAAALTLWSMIIYLKAAWPDFKGSM